MQRRPSTMMTTTTVPTMTMRTVATLLPINRIINTIIALLCTLPLLLGCDNNQRTTGLEVAVSQYEAGQYREAFDTAVRTQRAAQNPERARAAYVAGLAAYHLNQPDEAERRFLIAQQSPEPETAGRARAMLGTIRMDQDRPLDAAEHFKAAARLLNGREANEAAYRAGQAYQAGGDSSSARAQFTIAGSRANDSDLRASANEQLTRTGFAIQVGAFRDRANAETAAQEAQTIADRHGLGDVRIISQPDPRSGGFLHVVQFGQFGTRGTADDMRQRIGNLRWIVTRAD